MNTNFLILALGAAILGSSQIAHFEALHAISIVGVAQAASSKLGDLLPFRTIAVETAALVDKGDLPGAKVRIKALETRGDEAEAGLKPRDAAEWHKIDKAIDHALEALRAGTPDAALCRKTLGDLLAMFDAAAKA